jgi:hypothetical protein
VPERPTLPSTALTGLALACVLTGCAGTDSAAARNSSSASPTPSSSSAVSTATTTAAEGRRIEVTVTGGQVTGDTGRVAVAAGEQVTLVITADVADEVHVHGYDRTTALTPGAPAALSFAATLPGVFEVELHEAGTVLLSLQVG